MYLESNPSHKIVHKGENSNPWTAMRHGAKFFGLEKPHSHFQETGIGDIFCSGRLHDRTKNLIIQHVDWIVKP
jgi:hypothetical protein